MGHHLYNFNINEHMPGWIDQDATWYGGRSIPFNHIQVIQVTDPNTYDIVKTVFQIKIIAENLTSIAALLSVITVKLYNM